MSRLRGALACLLFACLVGAAPAATATDAAPAAPQIERGRYLLQAGNCAACHTRRGGKPWAGGRAVPTPFGTIYSSNLTSDRETGIGAWSRDDFWRALHEGRSPDGSPYYPAFPYDFFTRIRRADSDAMFAALQALPAVRATNRAPRLGFPWNQRWLLNVWRALYFSPGEQVDDPERSAAWNRGAYLGEALGHCGACHTPRNRLGATLDADALGGGLIAGQGWVAPDLHGDDWGGLHGWTQQDLTDFFATGRSARGTAWGPMREIVAAGLQHLTDADQEALATWLLEQPARPAPRDWERLQPPAWREAARQASPRVASGEALYRKHCADCHGRDGRGRGVYASLRRSNAVRAALPVNVIRMVLLGGFEPATKANPRPWSMPPFAPQLDDAAIADVVSYVRHHFGDGARGVTPEQVAEYRSTPVR